MEVKLLTSPNRHHHQSHRLYQLHLLHQSHQSCRTLKSHKPPRKSERVKKFPVRLDDFAASVIADAQEWGTTRMDTSVIPLRRQVRHVRVIQCL